MKEDFVRILKLFAIWRVSLFAIAFLAIFIFPHFGATFPYYDRVLEITHLPNWIWGFGNFDGVHYLRIAQDGYQALASQAFFPVYPIIIRVFAFVLPQNPTLNTSLYVDPSYFYSALFVTHIFFLSALFVFYKLLRLDYKRSTSLKAIVLLLVFPTAFYFGAIYTESLFLLLAVSSIYLIRKGKYFPAAILITIASATRVVGVLLIIVYLIELLRSKRISVMRLLALFLLPVGLGVYMFYLNANFGDPLYFLHTQPVFGADRAGSLVLPPQVLYRYFRILTTVGIANPAFFTAVLELGFTIISVTTVILLYKKMRLSYWLFSLSMLLLPTLTGTLSSMPRYALMAFLVLPYIAEFPKRRYIAILIFFSIIGAILSSLFLRGYWVA